MNAEAEEAAHRLANAASVAAAFCCSRAFGFEVSNCGEIEGTEGLTCAPCPVSSAHLTWQLPDLGVETAVAGNLGAT